MQISLWRLLTMHTNGRTLMRDTHVAVTAVRVAIERSQVAVAELAELTKEVIETMRGDDDEPD